MNAHCLDKYVVVYDCYVTRNDGSYDRSLFTFLWYKQIVYSVTILYIYIIYILCMSG